MSSVRFLDKSESIGGPSIHLALGALCTWMQNIALRTDLRKPTDRHTVHNTSLSSLYLGSPVVLGRK